MEGHDDVARGACRVDRAVSAHRDARLSANRGAPAPSAPAAAPELTFAGAAKCASCHPKEAEAHRGSDHALAMQPANQQTVLGDFRDAVFRHRGVTSTFSRRDGKFLVRTDGPDGKPGEFEIAYTFGVKPLQQYLIPRTVRSRPPEPRRSVPGPGPRGRRAALPRTGARGRP